VCDGVHLAIAAVLTFNGGTLERYDMLLAKLGFESGQAGPRGALFSWVTMTEDGLLVTGVWNSKRDFEQSPPSSARSRPRSACAGPRRSRSTRSTAT